MVNAGIIRPINETPSPVDNIVVLEDTIEEYYVDVPNDEADIKVQECKEEKSIPDMIVTELDRILVGPDGRSFYDKDGQQCSVRVKQYQEGHIHLIMLVQRDH